MRLCNSVWLQWTRQQQNNHIVQPQINSFFMHPVNMFAAYIGLISVCLWDCEWWGLFNNKKQICIISCGRFAATQMPQNMKSTHICTIFANNSLTKSNVGKCRQGWPVCLGWPKRFCQLVSGTTILFCYSGAVKWNVLCKQGLDSVETSFPSSFEYIIGT